MKRLFLVLLALLSAASTGYAQARQGAWWLTGFTGLNFSVPDPPSVVLLPSGVGYVSQATLSDAYGNLSLFGIGTTFLFNREFMPMENASFPVNSGAILILPDPVVDHFNHVLSCDSFDGRAGNLHYTLVDMRLDSGRGDAVVRPPVPGQPWPDDIIERGVTSKLTTAMHTNNRDVWIIYPNAAGDTLRTRLLSPAGLSAPASYATGAPVRLASRLPRSIDFRAITQIMRASLDGRRLACPTDSTVELFTFDRATGAPAHWLSLPLDGGPAAPRYMQLNGATFSPDNTKLYVTRIPRQARVYTPPQPALVQFDLTPGTTAGILGTRTNLLTLPGWYGVLDVQVAMDGRLYFFADHDSANVLGCVRCPNQAGAACQVRAIHRRGIEGAFAPALNQTLFRNAGRLQAQAARPLSCPGDTVRLIAFGAGAETFAWTTAAGQVLPGAQPLVAPPVPTRYFVTGTGACGTTDTASVVVRLSSPLAPFDLGPDVVLPVGQSITLAVNNPGQQVRWSTGDTTQTLLVTAPGLYWARVFNAGGCQLSDTVRVLRPLGLLTAAEVGAGALRVWPNPAPAGGGVQVAVAAGGPVMLLDALGRVVRRAVAGAGHRVAWALADLPAGVYVVRAAAATRRLVVE